MGCREVQSNREVLECAIVDGINRYLRDILRPRGIVKDENLPDAEDDFITVMKYQVAKQVALSWEYCQINDGE